MGACSFSQPPAPPSSKNPPVAFLKVVPYSENHALVGYFTLADSATNQIAAEGQLTLRIYTKTKLSLNSSGAGQTGGMTWKNTLYDHTFLIGTTNFHWETFGSIFVVRDLNLRFAVPYANFKTPIQPGRVVTVELELRPDSGTNVLFSAKQVSLY